MVRSISFPNAISPRGPLTQSNSAARVVCSDTGSSGVDRVIYAHGPSHNLSSDHIPGGAHGPILPHENIGATYYQ